MFRCVDLPAHISGRLLLHSMPGRYEALERVWYQVRNDAVQVIVCLTERDEIHEKSYEYAQALDNGAVPCLVLLFEIPDGVRRRIGMVFGRFLVTSRIACRSAKPF